MAKHWPSILEVLDSSLSLIPLWKKKKKDMIVFIFKVIGGFGCNSHDRVFVYNAETQSSMFTTGEKNIMSKSATDL